MLEYVNSLNRKSGISRRYVVCFAVSCFFHFCVILTLYLFPQLLAGGYLHQFRGFRWGTSSIDEDMEQWRMVAILESTDRMNMPSLETLREFLGRGDREEGLGTPPIEVRFGPPEALETDKPPLPQIPPKIDDPEVIIPEYGGPGVDDETKPDTGSSDETPQPDPSDPGTGRDDFAAKPDAPPVVDVAANTVPLKIPEDIPPPQSPVKPNAAKPSAANESASRSGAGLFDTAGFPMGDYKEVIEALVRSRWSRPSNIIGSQRKAVIVFYIDRNGHVSGLYTEVSSGNDSLDRAAMSAIWGAPFPPLPKGFPREQVGVRLIMVDD